MPPALKSTLPSPRPAWVEENQLVSSPYISSTHPAAARFLSRLPNPRLEVSGS